MAPNSPFLARLGGDLVRAGDLYYERGQLAKAAEMYTRAGRVEQAVEVWLKAGEVEQAVQLLLDHDQTRRAGELLLNAGDLKAALPHLEAGGAYLRAAECALRLKQPGRAARLYARARNWEQAAEAFAEAGEVTQELEALGQLSQQLERESKNGDGVAGQHHIRVDLQRAERLAKVGNYRPAAVLFRRCRQPARAAELYARAGAAEEAVHCWVEADQAERALPLLEKAKNLDLSVHGQVLVRSGRAEEAAQLFVQAGDRQRAAEALEASGETLKAAELWRQAGEPDRAGILFARAERWGEAAEMLESAGHFLNAAEAYEKADRPEKAAGCYVRQDEPIKAANAYAHAARFDRALELLQDIPDDHPEFVPANHLLVKLLVREGNYNGALHRLQMIPRDPHATGPRALEQMYWEARVYEGMEDWRKAEAGYQRVEALKRGYRDIPQRLEQIRETVDRLRREGSGVLLDSGSGVFYGSGNLSEEGFDPAATSPTVPTPPNAVQPGTVLVDRYEIRGDLGHGGMSRVYRAQDRVLGEEVAIKMLHPSFHGDDQKRLLREVQISRKITHPNVVRVYDIGTSPWGVFVTMELLEGPDLEQSIRGEQRIPLPRVGDLLHQILEGLQTAHALKTIHRDLKPRNIILTPQRLKILDFGIARMEGVDIEVTSPGQVIGSPLYMSPEQIRGEELDTRADLYCVGLIAFGLLANREPFRARTPEAVVFKQLHERPPDLRKIRPTLPGPWPSFVEKLLEKNRDERYRDAQETLAILENLPVSEPQ